MLASTCGSASWNRISALVNSISHVPHGLGRLSIEIRRRRLKPVLDRWFDGRFLPSGGGLYDVGSHPVRASPVRQH